MQISINGLLCHCKARCLGWEAEPGLPFCPDPHRIGNTINGKRAKAVAKFTTDEETGRGIFVLMEDGNPAIPMLGEYWDVEQEMPASGSSKKLEYYLVESKAPDGYNPLKTPLIVSLTMEDFYYTIGHRQATDDDGQPLTTEMGAPIMEDYEIPLDASQLAGALYNWRQIPTIALQLQGTAVVQETMIVVNEDEEEETVPAVVDFYYDASGNLIDLDEYEGEVSLLKQGKYYLYRIANNPGIELPATGGITTTPIYLLGSFLILSSTIILFNKTYKG